MNHLQDKKLITYMNRFFFAKHLVERRRFFVGLAERKQATAERLNHWSDLWFSDRKRAGYVAIGNVTRPKYYGLNDKSRIPSITAGKGQCYITLNAFDADFQTGLFSRKAERLKQIRNIGVDLDQYKLGITIEQAIDTLQVLILEEKIPEPNLVLTSRGVQIFYSISGGASPKMEWLASYITEQFIEKLQGLGADFNAKDMSRFMRVPFSVNERNGAVVDAEIWNPEAYTLQELQAYCRPFDDYNRNRNRKGKIIQLAEVDNKLLLFYRTNYARLRDLRKLIELRKGDFTGMRNVFVYVYAFHQSLVSNTLETAKIAVKSDLVGMYSRTDKPMTKKEMDKTISSAYHDCEKFFKAYRANGNRMMYSRNDGIIKPYTTNNLIKKLEMTEEEQYLMSSIRNAKITKKQHADYMREKRRAEGVGSMAEYNNTRSNRKAVRMAKIAELKALNPTITQRELADILKVSVGTINAYMKEIN